MAAGRRRCALGRVAGLGLAALILAAGCLSASEPASTEPLDAAGTDAASGDSPAGEADPWANRTEVPILAIRDPADAWQLDVLCLTGGAPQMPRTDERVLPGTGHLAIELVNDGVGTPLQLGYVVDPDAGPDEVVQEGITWLDPVPPRGAARFEVPVGPDEVERPGEARLWAFYLRANPGEDALCYTGAHVGELSLDVVAVRGAGG